MVGGVMLKLLVILGLGIYVTLQLAGTDRGQMRPGLANAEPEATVLVEIVPKVETRTLAAVATTSPPETATMAIAEPEPVVVEVTYKPRVDASAPQAPLRPADKVFTLSDLPGQQNAPETTVVATSEAVTGPAPEVWYVTGRSVNVRMGPSTDAPIVGKLLRGDAALMLADNGAGWAQVTVEGDGVTGYVSMDFISPDAP